MTLDGEVSARRWEDKEVERMRRGLCDQAHKQKPCRYISDAAVNSARGRCRPSVTLRLPVTASVAQSPTPDNVILTTCRTGTAGHGAATVHSARKAHCVARYGPRRDRVSPMTGAASNAKCECRVHRELLFSNPGAHIDTMQNTHAIATLRIPSQHCACHRNFTGASRRPAGRTSDDLALPSVVPERERGMPLSGLVFLHKLKCNRETARGGRTKHKQGEMGRGGARARAKNENE